MRLVLALTLAAWVLSLGPGCGSLALTDPPSPVVQINYLGGACHLDRADLVLPAEGLTIRGLVRYECVQIAHSRATGAYVECEGATGTLTSGPARAALPGESVGCARIALVVP